MSNVDTFPDDSKKQVGAAVVHPVQLLNSDEKIPFSAYLYYAAQQRKVEELPAGDERGALQDDLAGLSELELERAYARRALRAASWQSVFCLIVTDIIGPSSAPWAISTLGFLPGVLAYVLLGFAALYTGMLLWRLYMGLDSDRFPIRGYGDVAERVLGKSARHVVNVLQAIQLVFNVSAIILGNGQSLSQISKGKVCFSVLMLIFTVIGMAFSQFKTLRKISWLGLACVTLSLLAIFINMGVVPHSVPNFAGALAQLGVEEGPVITQLINRAGFSASLVAVMNIVYAYGGALMFVEFMTELRRPMDFFKAMCCAQAFILVVYLWYGLFIYAYQGQFSMIPASQGISVYVYQTLTNCIGLVTGLIVAALYGHVGLRAVYVYVVEDIFDGPVLTSRRGTFLWFGIVILYWAVAFVIASAIPQLANISGFVASICILQFTYGIPTFMHLVYSLRRDAILFDASYDPTNPHHVVTDSWRNASWWKKAIPNMWWLKLLNGLVALAALAAGGLGAYASITSIIAGFQAAAASTSFTCAGPV